MRYAVFTDIHANLEALEAVLAKIDELAQEEPIDQVWFLGDLVGYGPNPNECIEILRARTDVIIAGNHDWAAVGKIDLEDFSEAARISAEWTAEQLSEEHRQFLTDLPERIVIDECTLVHGSPYGPLWEYLTTEVLAERSFQYFHSRYCLVGHTHVPVIFLQPDTISNTPTIPLAEGEEYGLDTSTPAEQADEEFDADLVDDDETIRVAAIRPTLQNSRAITENVTTETEALQAIAHISDLASEAQQKSADDEPALPLESVADQAEEATHSSEEHPTSVTESTEAEAAQQSTEDPSPPEDTEEGTPAELNKASTDVEDDIAQEDSSLEKESEEETTPEETITNAESRLNEEIEELLALLGLSQSMINVTNEMLDPPEGDWQAPEKHRAIVNPGGVGQPRDGDPRAAFMIFDTERGFTFYRVPYELEKTQEKIMQTGLPPYLATRLAYGR